MDFKYCKLEIFLPPSHLEVLQKALQEVDAGHIGNYDSCMSVSPVTGYFEIFLQRMLMCKRAAEILGLKFKMKANGNKIC